MKNTELGIQRKDNYMVTIPFICNVGRVEAEQILVRIFSTLSAERQHEVINQLSILHQAEIDLTEQKSGPTMGLALERPA